MRVQDIPTVRASADQSLHPPSVDSSWSLLVRVQAGMMVSPAPASRGRLSDRTRTYKQAQSLEISSKCPRAVVSWTAALEGSTYPQYRRPSTKFSEGSRFLGPRHPSATALERYTYKAQISPLVDRSQIQRGNPTSLTGKISSIGPAGAFTEVDLLSASIHVFRESRGQDRELRARRCSPLRPARMSSFFDPTILFVG